MKASDYLFVIIALILAISPFIVVADWQIDINKEVTSAYLNGLITACGIFVGFIAASVISKTKDLDSLTLYMTRITLFLFTASIINLSFGLIVYNKVTILGLAIFSSTLILASLTAWNILNLLIRENL